MGASALTFQVSVLYPWHNELDKEFKNLKNNHIKTLDDYHNKKLLKLEQLEKRIIELHKVLNSKIK